MPTAPTCVAPRVLLVDDAPAVLSSLTGLLVDYHIQVVGQATDGDQVLAAVAEAFALAGGVDVVVMDERMPHVSGLEATRALRAVFPGVAVVLYSASVGHLGDQPHLPGVTAEVPKGAHPRVLVAAIQHACQLARADRSRPRSPERPGAGGPRSGREGRGCQHP